MECFSSLRDKTRSWGRKQQSAPISSCSTTTERCASSGTPGFELYAEKGHTLRAFSFSELARATNNFSWKLVIGEGESGTVFRATIRPVGGEGDPISVAVKRLGRDGFQGAEVQWLAGVQFLGAAEHRNLVKLVGYCAEDGDRGFQRLLVYELMQNKSLEDHLFRKAYPVLAWQTRLQIALGAAEGLAYLHEQMEVEVIFREFKTSNVLLDDGFKPKLSDFGLVREEPADDLSTTAVVGTYDEYAAPDEIETGHLTSKSDVWTFGVVLYEILTGRRSLERSRPKSERKLLEWVKLYPANGRKFKTIMDPRLEDEYSLSAATLVARLAERCLVRSAKDRPKMSEVAEKLKEAIRVSGEGT